MAVVVDPEGDRAANGPHVAHYLLAGSVRLVVLGPGAVLVNDDDANAMGRRAIGGDWVFYPEPPWLRLCEEVCPRTVKRSNARDTCRRFGNL